MTNPLTVAAEEIRSNIGTNIETGSKLLLDFANEYAVDQRLKHSALLLRLQSREPDGHWPELGGELNTLLDNIITDNYEYAHKPEVIERRAALENMYEHFRKLEPKHEIAVKGNNLRRQYGRKGFTLAPVNLELRIGEITALVGQNAHGKTTLLRIIAGELAIDSGELRYPYLLGEETTNIDWIKVKNQMAYVPQDLPAVTGSLYENLRIEAAIHGILGKDNDREVDYAVERLGLAEHLDKKWKELSGGYKLRFSLARVLVWKPRLLIIDEPLANLDVKAQVEFLLDLQQLSRSMRYPMAVFMSSQNLHELEAIADNLLFLRRGEVQYNGPVSEIGESREWNAFEIGTKLSLSEIRSKLDAIDVENLEFNGVHFELITPLCVTNNNVLKVLMAQGVNITYFRDISRSSRMLFE